MTAFRVIKFSKGSDGAPAEWTVLCITMRAAAHLAEITGSRWISCLRRSSLELELVFCKNLFDTCFLVVINPWVPKSISTYVAWLVVY